LTFVNSNIIISQIESNKIFFKNMKKVKKYKLKTLSGAKKRFKVTGTGKILAGCPYKRHNMRKRSLRFIRNTRGMRVLKNAAAKVVLKAIPNGL
jgi:large subunit ribosomal protein L35